MVLAACSSHAQRSSVWLFMFVGQIVQPFVNGCSTFDDHCPLFDDNCGLYVPLVGLHSP